MTDLELINRQIVNVESRLKRIHLTEEQLNPNYKYKQSDIQYREYAYLNDMLIQLEQIKSILEAWEIIKDNTIITNNRCDVDRIEMYNGGKGYNIFKKALKKNEK